MSGLMALFAMGSAIHATIGVFLSSFIEDYSLQSAAQGLCGSAESAGFLLCTLFSALLLKKLPKPKVVLFSAGLMAVVLPLVGLHPPYMLLLICYGIFGMSYGTVDSLASSILSDAYPDSSAEKISAAKAVYCFGGMVAPLFLQWLMKRGLAWNRVALITGGIGIAVFAFFAFFSMPRLPASTIARSTAEKMDGKDFLTFFRTPGAILTLIFAMVYNGHMSGQTIWMIRYVSEYMHAPAWGSYSVTLFWIGAFISRLWLPRFVKNQKKILIFGTLLSAVFYGIGILSGNGKLMTALMLVIGLAEGATIPVLVSYACSLKREMSAVACSSIMLATNTGSIIFSALIGALIDVCGAERGILILPLSALICAGLGVRLKEAH